jgi:hypothetical protein
MALSKRKKNKRKTVAGLKCADTFTTDNGWRTVWYDCSNRNTPDGKITEKEWCEIDKKEKAEKKWDYCQPILDYNKVRERVRDLLE